MFSAVVISSGIIEGQNEKKPAYRISSLTVWAYCDYIKTAITKVASVASLQIAALATTQKYNMNSSRTTDTKGNKQEQC